MTDQLTRRLNLQGMLLQGAYYFALSTYMVFMVTTLMDYGWTASAAAGAMTVMSVIVLLIQPLIGLLSDKKFSEKKLAIALMAVSAFSFFMLPTSLASGSTFLVWLTMAAITVTTLPAAGMLDAWVVGLNQEFKGMNYGLIRGTGALTFAIAAQVSGVMTQNFGHDARLFMGGCSLFLAVIAALSFRPIKKKTEEGPTGTDSPQITGKEAFRLILTSRPYVLLLVTSFFLMLTTQSLSVLLQLLILDFGGTSAQIGTASAFMAGSEVPIMFLMAYLLKNFGYKRLFLFTGAFYVLRMFLMGVVGSVDALIFVQLFQGLTFAILIPLTMSFLPKILDDRIRTTGINLFSALTGSLTGILANFITTSLVGVGVAPQRVVLVFAFAAFIGFCFVVYGAATKTWDLT